MLGSLALFWRTPGYEPSQDRVAAIEQIAATSIPAIENARRYREARQLAETDALTGFFNQRYFHETLRREALRAQRYDRRLALLIIDLDDFKAVNDRIGHLAGDAVLAQVAERLRNEIRSVDIGCRVGGDEFGVIMPESDRRGLLAALPADARRGRGDAGPRGTARSDLRGDRRAPSRRDRRRALRARGLGALPREGARQGPCERRDRLGPRRTRAVRRPAEAGATEHDAGARARASPPRGRRMRPRCERGITRADPSNVPRARRRCSRARRYRGQKPGRSSPPERGRAQSSVSTARPPWVDRPARCGRRCSAGDTAPRRSRRVRRATSSTVGPVVASGAERASEKEEKGPTRRGRPP